MAVAVCGARMRTRSDLFSLMRPMPMNHDLVLPRPPRAPSTVRATQVLLLGWALLLTPAAAPALTTGALPPTVAAALARAKLPPDALSVIATSVDARETPRLFYRADIAVNPASVMKLVTTYAGLELLGPAYTWRTSVYLNGTLQGGTLAGDLHIQGGGDPKLVVERLWLLLRRIQGLGVQKIAGDIVLDRSAFAAEPVDLAAFDNEPLRPYNAAPDALLVNFKALQLDFVPDAAAGVARVQHEPPLAGVDVPATVPLAAGACGDWRAALQLDFQQATRLRLPGRFAASCGNKRWSIAPPDADRFGAQAIAGVWRAIGGGLTGTVRDGRVPAGLSPLVEFESPPLADVIRDINKFSNNLMAQQLYYTLSMQPGAAATAGASRDAVERWWRSRLPGAAVPLMDNGSGLSREARIRPDTLARMLQAAFHSPLMPEFISSLPIPGVDGTLRRSKLDAAAHLKSGSLRDVQAIAGYVEGLSGRRHVLVAVLNDPNANAGRAVLDALVEWTRNDQTPARP